MGPSEPVCLLGPKAAGSGTGKGRLACPDPRRKTSEVQDLEGRLFHRGPGATQSPSPSVAVRHRVAMQSRRGCGSSPADRHTHTHADIHPGLTPTPTPTPRPTAVLRSTSDAVATLWAYLVGCFPALSTSDLESTLDPPSGEYIVKDRASNVYGVRRVNPDDGSISPDNAQARTKDRRVTGGTC